MLVEIYVDGAVRNNGIKGKRAEAACAYAIYVNHKPVTHYARGLGICGNNAAEYEALISALSYCVGAGVEDPIIYSDSAVVCNQVSGKWRCRSKELLPLYMSVRIIQQRYRFRMVQVHRSEVKVADALCNEFLDKLSAAYKKGALVDYPL